uniref:Fcf2 pre-rRNA processing C-terminal domain-containing protein n=1 Tax=Schizophyllum commune (strain H4-8 / FGSC 9210) TaxID=578458 RepID=D8Q447_SCHCM
MTQGPEPQPAEGAPSDEEDESSDDSDDSDSGSEDSDSASSSAASSSSSSCPPEMTLEALEGLWRKARDIAAAAEKESSSRDAIDEQEDVIQLDTEPGAEERLPRLELSTADKSYFTFDRIGKGKVPLSLRDPEIERAEKAMADFAAPAPPEGPPELTKSGKPLTKREKKEVCGLISATSVRLKKRTAGPAWFDLPAPPEADLPRLYREVEALRLRNQLDPKRFYRKDEGEGKGIKGLPKHFAIGTIVPSPLPFGGASSENLTRAERKRSLVDELVDDAEATRYAKRKFGDLQGKRGAAGRNTRFGKQRRTKW